MPPPPLPAGSGDQFNAAQLNSIIANQQQVNSNSGANVNTVAAIQSNVAGAAINKGELQPADLAHTLAAARMRHAPTTCHPSHDGD